LLELKGAGGNLRHHITIQLKLGIRSLKVKTVRQFPVSLIDSVGKLMFINLRHHIKRRHRKIPTVKTGFILE